MDPDFANATEVADLAHEVTRQSYLARDFEAFARRFHLPHTVGTFEGTRTIRTREDLREMFDSVVATLEANNVVDLHRLTISARFIDADTVQTTFSSRHMLRGDRLGEQLIGHGLLRRIDGVWRVSDHEYAAEGDAYLARALGIKPSAAASKGEADHA